MLFASLQVNAQQSVGPVQNRAGIDSIDRRIAYLRKQIENLKHTRDVRYFNYKRELDHALFIKEVNEYIADEDLDKAKSLVAEKIKKSEFVRDQASVKFYRDYEEKIYLLIKNQRMYYQALFKKENNLRKAFESWIAPGTINAYIKAQRMVKLALKYARENNLNETIVLLEKYNSQVEALIFDYESDYDLAMLTDNAKSFEKAFMPLVTGDSMQHLKEAEKLLSHCITYSKYSGSALGQEYFRKQEMLLTSALSDLLERQGREKELSRYTDESVVAQFDTINPCGVFKWHEQIVVIDEFLPQSSMESVRKGEAILHADKMLATYLKKNKLCQSPDELKFGPSFVIPYQSDLYKSCFYFNKVSQKWQFIVCYTLVNSKSFTLSVSKFMPPLFFENELSTAQNFPD